MIGATLFVVFVVLMLAGVPIGVALGVGGALAIGLSNLDTAHWGLLAVPLNFYASLTKYPLLALHMFVLVGSIFDRSGIAQRLVNFAVAILGRGPGMLLGRQEAKIKEPVGRQARQRQRRHRRAGAGDGDDMMPRRARIADQLIAGIGDQRRARIGHQGDRLARHACNQSRPYLFGIMVVVRGHWSLDADVIEQLARHAAVFNRDYRGIRQNMRGAR